MILTCLILFFAGYAIAAFRWAIALEDRERDLHWARQHIAYLIRSIEDDRRAAEELEEQWRMPAVEKKQKEG